MTVSEEIKTYLDLLNLGEEKEINESIIKKAYLKKSKIYHPDVCEEQYKDGVMFKKINDANTYLKNNIDTVNDYLKNPSKYNYSQTNNYTNTNTYAYNMNDMFSEIFKAYQKSYQQTYTEEDIKKIKKEQRKARFRRKLGSLFSFCFGGLMTFVSPALGIFIMFFSVLSLF